MKSSQSGIENLQQLEIPTDDWTRCSLGHALEQTLPRILTCTICRSDDAGRRRQTNVVNCFEATVLRLLVLDFSL